MQLIEISSPDTPRNHTNATEQHRVRVTKTKQTIPTLQTQWKYDLKVPKTSSEHHVFNLNDQFIELCPLPYRTLGQQGRI